MRSIKKMKNKSKTKDKCSCEVSCEAKEIIEKASHQGKQYVIPLLQKVQEQEGNISEGAMDLISKKLNVSAGQIYAITTFYSYFRLRPIGKYLVRPCRGTACHVKGATRIIDKIKENLGLTDLDTTADNEFTLDPVACLGACGLAPVMVVGEGVYGDLDEDKAVKIINSLKK